MPQNPTYSCYLGAIGWEHTGWEGGFYPEDLPTEWRLAYYNNFFSCVYLTFAQWAGIPASVWRERLNDLQPQFRLILQTPNALQDSERTLLNSLAPHVGLCDGECPAGFVQSGSLLWFESNLELKQLAGEISERKTSGAPIYLISRDGNLGALEQVGTLLEVIGC